MKDLRIKKRPKNSRVTRYVVGFLQKDEGDLTTHRT